MDGRIPALRLVDEYSDKGHLIHLEDCPGAFLRGATRKEALDKLAPEYLRWHRWAGLEAVPLNERALMIEKREAGLLADEDADTEIFLESEPAALTKGEYDQLKALALKSARDFLTLYGSIPDRDFPLKETRQTFYGNLPVTATAMYEHTLSVNSFYFAGIGIALDQNDDLLSGRIRGFQILEEDDLENRLSQAADGEAWTLRKIIRRFIWHDAIHAKALYRSATHTFQGQEILNPFFFSLSPLPDPF